MKRPYLLQKRTAIWYYRLAGEKTFHSTGIRKRADAEKWVLGKLDKPAPSEVTLEEFTLDFFIWGKCDWIRKQLAHDKAFGKTTAMNRRGHLEKHILPKFGKRRISDLSKAEIESWLSALPLANQTRNHILYTLRIVLREAVDGRIIAENPLRDAATFGKRYVARDVFSISELAQLFPSDPAELLRVWGKLDAAVMFMILASTGIRAGEVRALRWRHVLWDQKALLVEDAARGRGRDIETGAISGKKGGTKIALLTSRTEEVLRQWHAKTLLPDADDLVFPGFERGPLQVTTISRRLPIAMKRAGIEANGRNLVVHSLRHTFSTHMRRQVSEEILHALTGHHSREMSDRYDHPALIERLADVEPAREALEGIL